MNKFILSFLILGILGFSNILQAECCNTRLEIRSSAFFPSSKRVRNLYADTIPTVGVEASTNCFGCYDIWVDFDYLNKNNHKSCCKSKLEIFNGSFGLKYAFPFVCSDFQWYVGIGPCIGAVVIRNHNRFSKEKISKVRLGAVLKSGVIYDFYSNLYLNAFVDYIYQPVKYQKTINVGGVKTGLGIGIRF